jgi:hypothetical protein
MVFVHGVKIGESCVARNVYVYAWREYDRFVQLKPYNNQSQEMTCEGYLRKKIITKIQK